jgi:hypothetical protein
VEAEIESILGRDEAASLFALLAKLQQRVAAMDGER